MYLPCVCTLASKDPTLYILYGSITGFTKSKYQHDTIHYAFSTAFTPTPDDASTNKGTKPNSALVSDT